METNSTSGSSAEQNDPGLLFGALETDRATLADSLRQPAWFAPSLGILAAIYIATPALPEAVSRGFINISLVVAGILLLVGYRRTTGIKLLRFRPLETMIFAAAIVTTLFFFSISLGLAASGLPLWIIATATAGFLTATTLAVVGAISMRERMRDVA
jgi:hypothetical protein